MKKRIFSIALIFTLISPGVGIFCWLQYQKALVKHEVKWKIIEGIALEELVLLKFTKVHSETLLRWEHPGEFEYNGQMFDVVESLVKGDTVYYWCWWDHQETSINKQLTDLTIKALQNNPERKRNQDRLTNFFKTLYSDDILKWEPVDVVCNQEINTVYHDQYHSISLPPPNPPPRLS